MYRLIKILDRFLDKLEPFRKKNFDPIKECFRYLEYLKLNFFITIYFTLSLFTTVNLILFLIVFEIVPLVILVISFVVFIQYHKGLLKYCVQKNNER